MGGDIKWKNSGKIEKIEMFWHQNSKLWNKKTVFKNCHVKK